MTAISRSKTDSKARERALANLADLAERLRPAFQRHHIDRAIVFGSVARGDASPRSDLDLILIKRTNKRFLDRYENLLYDLYDSAPERPIEALVYTPEELAHLSGRPFVATALREGKVIYESQEESARRATMAGHRG